MKEYALPERSVTSDGMHLWSICVYAVFNLQLDSLAEYLLTLRKVGKLWKMY